MGIVGRYIDSLSEEQKDRIIRAKGWCTGTWSSSSGDKACLVAHASAMEGSTPTDVEAIDKAEEWEGGRIIGRSAYEQFDMLCDRFGTDRIVRLIKLRAGASVEDLEPTPEHCPA